MMILIPYLIALLFIHSIVAEVTITPVPSASLPSNQNIVPSAGLPSNQYLVVENQLPLAEQTHELVKVEDIVLISQLSNSVLVKVQVDTYGVAQQVAGFQIANPNSNLHGLALSTNYPGMVWLTLEADNKLVLIDPVVTSVTDAPEVIMEIDVPSPGYGPHYIGEYGSDLWVSLKESYDVLRINYEDPTDYDIYNGLEHPIFVAQHPINGMFYSSQDTSSKIMKINPETGETTQIDVDASAGTTPVGMISGPNGIWFTLLGSNTAGTGTFGFIDQDDNIEYYKLTTPLGSDAALLHLKFDVAYETNYKLYLLSSSIINPTALDMIIIVTFDEQWSTIINEEVIVIPTQQCKAHRLLPTEFNVFATELSSSKLLTMFSL
ncbi:32501_t:CDS:1 [Gigaspora margarita]|uniref:32501_t:CDS:1 n=1 Tax=Gigaspora margarita TaxID=4874 RepID=A0ABN7ULA1_GIGMA|nr:32501_t:CDS:1 [Gigaspora margarita]